MSPRFVRNFLLPICLAFVTLPRMGSGEEIDFVRDVRPIFETHCYRCHGADKQKSGLRLDVKSAAFRGGSGHAPDIVPGRPADSPLFRFVSGMDPEMRMPPEGKGLDADQVATLEAWIAAGAPWPDGIDTARLEDRRDHWAFRPVVAQCPPPSTTKGWGRDDLDAFILSTLEAKGLSPSAPAPPLTWLRRVTFDLTGLPPTPEDARDFLAAVDRDGDSAYAAVVDRLLASPRHGERWAQHWLDVVRYADTHGFEVNTERPHAWPYRDYVIEALNADLPYDRFVREQLAGDVLGADPATGFLVTAAALLPGQIGKDEASKRLARQDELSEIVINTGEAFLGLSIGCARCHDHKFDPISAKDFYAMQAFFAGVRYGDRSIEDPEAAAEVDGLREQVEALDHQLGQLVPISGGDSATPAAPVNAAWNIDRFPPLTTSKVRFRIESTNRLEPCLDELEILDDTGRNVALASRGAKVRASGSKTSPGRHELRFLNDGAYGNSRSWMSNEVGKGWVEIEFPRPTTIAQVTWGRDRIGKFHDRLALTYRIEVPGPDDSWKTIASSDPRPLLTDGEPAKGDLAFPLALDSLPPLLKVKAETLRTARKPLFAQLAAHPGGRLVYAGVFGKPESIHLLTRGDPEQPRQEIAPAAIASLGDLALASDTGDADRRLALGKWLTDPGHPLTARVIVNRVWQGHFGIGFVETANDFGRAGAPPSHPELLDYLASEFVNSGWSLKGLHRRIVLSATYRQSNRIDPAAVAIDADVRLLWRFPSRRLEAEAIRDSMIASSGRLNLQMGGRGFDLFRSRGGLSGFPPVESFKKEGLRRMIYAHRVRMEREIVFGAFDCPDAGQSLPRRRQSTTPIQALNLFNSRFTLEESAALADRISREAGDEAAAQVSRAWDLVYQRPPSPEEATEAIALTREHGLTTLCRALYNSSEFLFLP